MLKWIWEHILWSPSTDVASLSARRTTEMLYSLNTRIGALEVDLAKLRGRVVGGLRQADLDADEDEYGPLIEEPDPVDDSRALGAQRRFGKGS